MANYCHHCAQRVTSIMRACPNCGTTLVDLAPGVAPLAPRPLPEALAAWWRDFRDGVSESAVPSRYPRAPFGPRLGAALIDAVVALLALVPGMGVVVLGLAANDEDLAVMGAVGVAAGALWTLVYGFTKDGGRRGQSIGKRLTGLMVVHVSSNRPCTRAQSLVRSLVMLACLLVPAVGWLIEPAAVLVVKDGRRLGDKAADTHVIVAADYAMEPVDMPDMAAA